MGGGEGGVGDLSSAFFAVFPSGCLILHDVTVVCCVRSCQILIASMSLYFSGNAACELVLTICVGLQLWLVNVAHEVRKGNCKCGWSECDSLVSVFKFFGLLRDRSFTRDTLLSYLSEESLLVHFYVWGNIREKVSQPGLQLQRLDSTCVLPLC